MGQMADDMISGRSCSWCGIYFTKPHGYPVVCKDCAKGGTKKELEESGVQKAIHPEL